MGGGGTPCSNVMGMKRTVRVSVRCSPWVGVLACAFAAISFREVEGACAGSAKLSTLADIKDKMRPSRPSGGSSYWPGGAGTGLHIYVDPVESPAYTADTHMYTKVSIHEYIHILQQAWMHGFNATTGPVPLRASASSQTRFHVINPCGADKRFEQLHVDALNGMGDDMKLLDVPTYVILYPVDNKNEKYGCTSLSGADLDAKAEEIFNTIYGKDCAGMWPSSDVMGDFAAKDGGPIAEGSAEYYALTEGSSAWTVFNGSAYWTKKLADDHEYCKTVGNKNFGLITTGGEGNIIKVMDANRGAGYEHCMDNPIGEIVWEAFLKFCDSKRFSCTHKDLKEVYVAASSTNWYAAFKAQYGVTWGDFICFARALWKLAGDCDAAAITQEGLDWAKQKYGGGDSKNGNANSGTGALNHSNSTSNSAATLGGAGAIAVSIALNV